jgi:hypothetical protein
MQTHPANDPGPAILAPLDLPHDQGALRTLDNQHRLARYLAHAVKTGRTPAQCKATLRALEVAHDHPHAAAVRLRCPYGVMPQLLHVDTSRLPADHGRVDRAPPAPLVDAAPRLLSELQAAHRLLVLALGCMTSKQQAKFAAKSERLGLGTDGATRHHDRAAVIAQATGSAA